MFLLQEFAYNIPRSVTFEETTFRQVTSYQQQLKALLLARLKLNNVYAARNSFYALLSAQLNSLQFKAAPVSSTQLKTAHKQCFELVSAPTLKKPPSSSIQAQISSAAAPVAQLQKYAYNLPRSETYEETSFQQVTSYHMVIRVLVVDYTSDKNQSVQQLSNLQMQVFSREMKRLIKVEFESIHASLDRIDGGGFQSINDEQKTNEDDIKFTANGEILVVKRSLNIQPSQDDQQCENICHMRFRVNDKERKAVPYEVPKVASCDDSNTSLVLQNFQQPCSPRFDVSYPFDFISPSLHFDLFGCTLECVPCTVNLVDCRDCDCSLELFSYVIVYRIENVQRTLSTYMLCIIRKGTRMKAFHVKIEDE
ncbi:hypothetical protein GQ457_10G010200 [Hibiscus cannabinus]